MKKQKVLALVLSLVMVVSMLAACGNNEQKDPTSGVSIDFEDSKSAFALIKTAPRKADESSLSVKDVNGSKVLYVTNEKGGSEMYLALDLDGLLGANVSKLAKIEMAIGADRTDSTKFTAISGKSYVFAGATAAELKDTRLGDWAVYTSSKNPNTVTFDLSGVTMTAGADTYFTLVKDTDAGSTPANFYIDNVKFLDKDGKLIECNKNVVMEPVGDKFIKEPEKPDVSAGVTFKDSMVPEGEWKQDCVIPAGFFDGFEGNVELTIKYELIAGDAGYLCWGFVNNDWKKLTKEILTADTAIVSSSVADNGDGFFAVDREATEITVVLTPEAVAELNKGCFGLTYHVDVYEITAKPAGQGSGTLTETIKGEEAYKGDWGCAGVVSKDVLAKFAGDVQVTIKFELTNDKDYYLVGPMDSWYAEMFGEVGKITDHEIKDADSENPTYHLQKDGMFVIDNKELTEITYTLGADTVKAMVKDGKDLGAKTYGVIIYEVVVSGKAKEVLTETVKGEEAYKGDWGCAGVVSKDVLAKFAGDIEVTIKFELTNDKDYYLAGPMDSWYAEMFGEVGKIIDHEIKDADSENPTYHLQKDGMFVIDNKELTEITYTLGADTVKAMVKDGKDLGAKTYGVIIYEVVVKGEPKQVITETVKGEEAYKGDWGCAGVVSKDVLAKFAGDIEVTIKFELTNDKDYYLAGPMDSWYAEMFGEVGKIIDHEIKDADSENPTYHLQKDGMFVIDNKELTEITYKLGADTVQAMVTEGKDLGAKTYGVIIYEVVVKGEAK